MARLIRDLIRIPERVHQSDFVLRLAEGIEHPGETLHTYVVTDQLLVAFQQALDLVRRALESPNNHLTPVPTVLVEPGMVIDFNSGASHRHRIHGARAGCVAGSEPGPLGSGDLPDDAGRSGYARGAPASC